jgi:L-lactate dehydrogenase complex protein LldG
MNPVLHKVRAALGGSVDARRAAVARWREERRPGPLAVVVDETSLVEAFETRARAVAADVVRVETATLSATVRSVAERCDPAGVGAVSDDPWLLTVLGSAVGAHARRGIVEETDRVGVVLAAAAAAETGTVLFASGPGAPTALAFLPEHCIAVLRRSTLFAHYNAAVRAVRTNGALPRCINLVTGPSRTADIEEVLLLGAHGPRTLTILLVTDA